MPEMPLKISRAIIRKKQESYATTISWVRAKVSVTEVTRNGVRRSLLKHSHSTVLKEARKGFFGCYSVCETKKDTKEG